MVSEPNFEDDLYDEETKQQLRTENADDDSGI